MKHGDKVYYHRHHHVKQAKWICWMTRGKQRLAIIQVKGNKQHIEVAPNDVEIEVEKEAYKYGQ